MKVWDLAGTELVIPGSVARHFNECATWPVYTLMLIFYTVALLCCNQARDMISFSHIKSNEFVNYPCRMRYWSLLHCIHLYM